MWPLAAMAVISLGQQIIANNQSVSNFNSQIKAQSEMNSAQSKAEGTETILNTKRAVETQVQKARQSLQLRGASQASAASANIGGNSVNAQASAIKLQADEAIAISRDDAEAKRQINRMSNESAYKATLYTAENYSNTSLGSMLLSTAISTAAAYYGGQLAGGSAGEAVGGVA